MDRRKPISWCQVKTAQGERRTLVDESSLHEKFSIARDKEQRRTTIGVHRQCVGEGQISAVDVKCVKFKENGLHGVGWAGFRQYDLLKYKSHM